MTTDPGIEEEFMRAVMLIAVAAVCLVLFIVSYFVTRTCFSTHGPPEQVASGVVIYRSNGMACTYTWGWKL